MTKPARHGLIQVYTGNGKGKTTCALGAGLRAAGHGLSVLMICFMKAKVAHRGGGAEINYGEYKSIDKIPNFTIIPVGRETFVDKKNPDPVDIKMAQEGLVLAQEALKKAMDLQKQIDEKADEVFQKPEIINWYLLPVFVKEFDVTTHHLRIKRIRGEEEEFKHETAAFSKLRKVDLKKIWEIGKGKEPAGSGGPGTHQTQTRRLSPPGNLHLERPAFRDRSQVEIGGYLLLGSHFVRGHYRKISLCRWQ